ncbi:hypothetical protein EDB85DRAFT_2160988 [Lactarius pseudohatsudake]|nr:hypothetical protein EDB85DRAFT_2160988 [Lactarius pseudohatsudake]
MTRFTGIPREGNFSMVVKGFPYPATWASCLVRLGNALLAGGSSTFFVKVIYVDRDYHAVEYTLYQRGPKPCDDSNDKVEYLQRPYDLSNRHDVFELVFRLYNFFPSMSSLHDKVSPRLAAALPSILGEVEYLHTSQEGMVWSPSNSLMVATEELQILQRLLAFRSEANHAIKLLDVIELNTELSSRCHRALRFYTSMGFAHLDLKPGNVLVHGSSGSLSPRLSIIDFGLSVIAESEENLG